MSMSEMMTTGQQILPFYLVCDESYSMSGAPLDSMNDSMLELHKEIGSNPVVSDKTRFAIVGFSDDAEVLLELSDLSMVTSLPVLAPRGGTSFAAAFRLLRDTIEKDVRDLKAQGNVVYRPVVFFLTDGYPTDEWTAEYGELTDGSNPVHPKILAFGIGDADDSVISKVATFRAFKADGTMSAASALREFAVALTKSIVKSGSTASSEGMTLQTPDEIPGFTALSVDAV